MHIRIHPVAVHVAQRAEIAAKVVAIVERAGEAALCARDLLFALDRPVTVEEEDVHRTAAVAAVVTIQSSHRHVHHLQDAAHGGSEGRDQRLHVTTALPLAATPTSRPDADGRR